MTRAQKIKQGVKKQQKGSLFSALKDINLFNVFILGVASGLPIVLVLSTLSIWLKELDISKTAIGLFALTTTPYTLKFLWSPLVDGLKIPFFTKKYGKRKSWLIITQLCLFISIALLGFSDPVNNLALTAIMTLSVAFFSATQDIIVDAYRIEILKKAQQGMGATLYVYGYRIGMLVSGAGALILAEYMDFSLVYFMMALSFLAFAIYSCFLKKTRDPKEKKITYLEWIKEYVVNPFQNFLQQPKVVAIIAFIILYKLGDAFAGIMTGPFLLELGFTKMDLAFYVKTFGLFATLFGSFLGGLLCAKYSLKKSLLIAGILQMVTNLIFCIQAMVGDVDLMLAITIGAENLAGGIGTIVFIAYLSALCNVKYSATQYALLSSFAAVARTWLSSSSGVVADHINWVEFFAFSTVLALPGLIFIMFVNEPKISRK